MFVSSALPGVIGGRPRLALTQHLGSWTIATHTWSLVEH